MAGDGEAEPGACPDRGCGFARRRCSLLTATPSSGASSSSPPDRIPEPRTSLVEAHQRIDDLTYVGAERPSVRQDARGGVRELGVTEERRVGEQAAVAGARRRQAELGEEPGQVGEPALGDAGQRRRDQRMGRARLEGELDRAGARLRADPDRGEGEPEQVAEPGGRVFRLARRRRSRGRCRAAPTARGVASIERVPVGEVPVEAALGGRPAPWRAARRRRPPAPREPGRRGRPGSSRRRSAVRASHRPCPYATVRISLHTEAYGGG